MQPTSLTWRGLPLGPGTAFRIRALDGWEEMPTGRYDKTPRARAHGAHRSPVYADERMVTVEGWCWSSDSRDSLLRELRRYTAFTGDDTPEPLTVTAAGLTLTAGAQLLAARPVLLRGEWGVGRFGWVLQWRCPDPLRYGPARVSAPTTLPTAGGGLAYPLAYPLDYGAPGNLGRVTVTNDGDADAPLLLTVTGPLPAGFEISAGDQRIRYPTAVPAGQTVLIDTGDGTVLVEGTADRRGDLTVADWIHVPAFGTLTLQFTSLGGAYDAAATLTAAVQDTYW